MTWKLEISQHAEKDLEWFRSHDKKLYTKCFDLVRAISKNPESGIGKPEKLKYENKNLYSRRVNREHRAVYIIDFEKKKALFLAFRKHYSILG